jgi:hypothetical protein
MIKLVKPRWKWLYKTTICLSLCGSYTLVLISHITSFRLNYLNASSPQAIYQIIQSLLRNFISGTKDSRAQVTHRLELGLILINIPRHDAPWVFNGVEFTTKHWSRQQGNILLMEPLVC